jgi:hypothetical protein
MRLHNFVALAPLAAGKAAEKPCSVPISAA